MTYNATPNITVKCPTLEEVVLVQGLRENKESAFRLMYKNYSNTLLYIIFRIVKNKEESEDILQETFIQISRKIQIYDADKCRFFTWIAKIARNKSLDYLKSSGNRNKVNTVNLAQLTDINSHLMLEAYNINVIGVKDLSDTLSSSQKQVINLLYYGGYTQLEASQALSLPLGTVKTKSRLALIYLRKQFDICRYPVTLG